MPPNAALQRTWYSAFSIEIWQLPGINLDWLDDLRFG
jgi:hypothetical protein